MYLRVKRKNQTVFVNNLESSDSIQKVKAVLSEVLAISSDDIKLFAQDKERVLEDEATIGGLELRNEQILYWVKRIDGASFESP